MSYHYYTYRTQQSPRLQPLNVSEIERFGSETAFLAERGYRELPGSFPGPITYFSSNSANDRFLIIARIEQNVFCFFAADRPALVSWKQQYALSPELVLDLLPGPVVPSSMVTIHLNPKVYQKVMDIPPLIAEPEPYRDPWVPTPASLGPWLEVGNE